MVSDDIKFYETDLLYGNDIIYKGLKILNIKLRDIKQVLFNTSFSEIKKYISDINATSDYDVDMNIKMLSMFVECYGVDVTPFGEYSIAKLENVFNEDKQISEEKFKITTLSDDDMHIIISIIKEMYWCRKANNEDSKLIDESKAGDEKTLEGIRKWNENQIKYNSKKESNTTIFSLIERCAALGLGGYNFTTIQELTLYQLQCLIEAHNADCTFRGYLSGIYSQADMKKIDMSSVNWC